MGLDRAIDITVGQRKTVLALLERHLPNTAAWVYGSRVKWTSRPQSDMDLVVFATPKQRRQVSDLREAFEESNLPFRVDLFVWDEVPEPFRAQIEADHVVLDEGEEQPVVEKWRATTLGEVVTLQRGFDLPTTERKPGAHPVVASAGTVGTHNRAMVHGPGVVVGRSGSLGGGQYIKRDFWPLNTTLWVKDFNANDPRFCYFLLQSLDLKRFNAGSGVPTLNRNHIHPLPVQVPPIPEQRAIAHILGTLDDKIELNRRMNETLEAMARALFKSWFVDFDPVRAKMEGRDPGESLPKHFADLFPNRLVDSELGEIPEGWEVKTLGELSHKPQYGYTASAKDEPIGPKFLRITDINKKAWIEWESVPYCEIIEDDSEKYRLHEGDILIARMADPGHGCMVEEEQSAVFASYLIRFRPIQKRFARFLQYWLRSNAYWELVRGRGAGTTRVSLNAKVLSGFLLVVPTDSLLDAFGEQTNSLRFRVVANSKESRILAVLRDTLLPRLISGEVRPANVSMGVIQY